ncbi:tetratricopeptide repeat protein [Gemmobacter lutimaris]|uniref:Tetratricopeptide repeat protein n=1 Tax=Gemmobacter lutimaris TaxID=2306023 RepID=A0A398BR71_9RHOB|nr:tetratricopeptide repeat protein [Gemmobacter lutimaris]RID93125.1 tetratricopeptide repeat protein [Gemmobacter lutimaris]
MKVLLTLLNLAVAAVFVLALGDAAAQAGPAEDAATLDRLFADLQTADEAGATAIESDIQRIWSRSGSASMDLLLERGRKALDQGDPETAIDHLTALTDHAPDFAEGWNARATAYFMAGRYGQAVSDIRHVLALNPRHFGALAGFGAILEQIDRKSQALEVYRAALAIHPHMQGVLEAVKRLETETSGQSI